MVAEDIAAQSGGDYYNLQKVRVKPKHQKKLDAILSMQQCIIPKDAMRSSAEVFKLFAHLGTELTEHFMIATLNNKCKVINIHQIGQGGVNQTPVDCKVIARHALVDMASGVVLCHNHPSGELNPSLPDKTLTKHVIDMLKLLDIKVLDHVIVGHNKYYSFSDEGTLDL
jgi:DNA repair protein RadC